MTWPKQKQAQDQRRNGDRSTSMRSSSPRKGLSSARSSACHGRWPFTDCGGNGTAAAMACGLTDMPQGTQALWGRSAVA